MSPKPSPDQMQLPELQGYESRHFKVSIGGTITDPKSLPASPPEAYTEVVGLFVADVGHLGFDPLVIHGDPAPVHTTKLNVSQVFVPLTETSRQMVKNLLAQLWEENRRAALGLGLIDPENEKDSADDPEAKAS